MYQEDLINFGKETLKKVKEAQIIVVATQDNELVNCLQKVEKNIEASIKFAESGELQKSKVLYDKTLQELDAVLE